MHMLTGCSVYVLRDLIYTVLHSPISSTEIKEKGVITFGRKNSNGLYPRPGIAIIHKDVRTTRAFYELIRNNRPSASRAEALTAARTALKIVTPQIYDEYYAWTQSKESILYEITQFVLLPPDWKQIGLEGMVEHTQYTPFDQAFWERFNSERFCWKY